MGQVCRLYLLNKDAQRVELQCFLVGNDGDRLCNKDRLQALSSPLSVSWLGKKTHSQNHYCFPLNEKIVTANPSDCVSTAVILKRDSKNCQMVAVDYSSIHLSSVLYHQSSDPDPHVGICSGEDDLLKWASGQGEKREWSYTWCQMVKRPKVSWFVYLINVSWTKKLNARCLQLTTTCSTSTIWDFQRLVVPKRLNIQWIHAIQQFSFTDILRTM